jgi:hypothetical protein
MSPLAQLTSDLPGDTARHSVTKQPHPHLGGALMVIKREVLGEVAVPHGLQ